MNALKAPEESFDEGTSRMEILTAALGFDLPFSVKAPLQALIGDSIAVTAK